MVADAYCARLMSLVGGDDPIAVLAETPAALARLIAGANPVLLSHSPAPGKWSIVQILSHLADSEIVFAFRVRAAIARDGAQLAAFEPDEWADRLRYANTEAAASVATFAAIRQATLDLVRRAPASSMEHVARHEEWGGVTVRELLRIEAGHDRNHLQQIERLRG